MTNTLREELPKQYNHHAAQQRWYPYWKSQGYFHAEPATDRASYSIVMPPPNVTGALHLGHALNNTLQDILIRFKRMQGYNVLWMPGTDHAGIATQAVVERRLLEEEGKSRHDLGREQLVQRIWAWKEQYEQRILEQLGQMGCSCDWERTRFTLDEVCARAVRHTFYSFFKERIIYRGKRLVNWDTYLQTAVSDDEVFHEEVAGHFWQIRYPVIDPEPGEPQFVSIATTRPETLLGDVAVAVHPRPAEELQKVAAELEAKLVAAPEKEKGELAAQLKDLQKRRQELLPRLEQLRDMARTGRRLRLPLLDREIPIVADVWAKPQLGSGCVKITPAHDPNDYEVGLRQGLPRINILNPTGTLNGNAGPYEGLNIMESRQQVVADLEEAGFLEQVEDRRIDLAHSDRSKTPIEPYLADQWFVAMDHLAQSAMDAVKQQRVKIFPRRYEKGYLDWLSEKRDWPVSRQLWWGHRIPVWSCEVKDADTLEQITQALEADPARQEDKLSYLVHPAEAAAEGSAIPAQLHVCIQDEDTEIQARVEALGFKQDNDVLDTWFSSALWPHSTLGWPDKTAALETFYPTSVLVTSRDIITLWVARMILAGLHNMGAVPFREVYIHPKILDGYGETMSKSKGNGVDPLDVIEKYGADALRFGIAHLATENQDTRMKIEFVCPHCETLVEQTKKNRILPVVNCPKCQQGFSTQWAQTEEDKAVPRAAVTSERFELGRNFCNKLWNASRFAMLNLGSYTPGAITTAELRMEDRWILSRLATVTEHVTVALEQYRYADVARVLYDFAWDEFCSFYIEMVKLRFEDEEQGPLARRVLAHTLDTLLRLLHPIIPFITEEVWQNLHELAPSRGLVPQPAAESIIIAAWPEVDSTHQDREIELQFSRFQAVLGGVREIRSRQQLAPKKVIDLSVRCDEATAESLRPMTAYFESMAASRATAWGPDVESPAIAASRSLPGMDIFVDLAGLIDIEAEIARTDRELERLARAIASKEKKLDNPNFLKRAPEDVVARERQSLEALQGQSAFQQATLEKLRGQ
jgi:valyl-tRNA synthetase